MLGGVGLEGEGDLVAVGVQYYFCVDIGSNPDGSGFAVFPFEVDSGASACA